MKKSLFLIAMAIILGAGLVSAATIQIQSTCPGTALPDTGFVVYSGASGGGTVNCTVAIPGGATNISAVLWEDVDGLYDSGQSGGSISFSETYPGGGVAFSGTLLQTGTGQSSGALACTGTCLTQVSTGSFSIVDTYTGNGAVKAASFDQYVVVTYTPSVVPEPATLSLIGGALLALGVFGRKRFSRP
jgi:hypothetical protein